MKSKGKTTRSCQLWLTCEPQLLLSNKNGDEMHQHLVSYLENIFSAGTGAKNCYTLEKSAFNLENPTGETLDNHLESWCGVTSFETPAFCQVKSLDFIIVSRNLSIIYFSFRDTVCFCQFSALLHFRTTSTNKKNQNINNRRADKGWSVSWEHLFPDI